MVLWELNNMDKPYTVEGVNFNPEVVRAMDKREFIERHKGVFFLGRDVDQRERMLSDIYDRIKGKKKVEPPILDSIV